MLNFGPCIELAQFVASASYSYSAYAIADCFPDEQPSQLDIDKSEAFLAPTPTKSHL